MTTKITKRDLIKKIGQENLARIERNIFCGQCGVTTMAGYEDTTKEFSNGDMVLHGSCKTCGGNVARVIETGE